MNSICERRKKQQQMTEKIIAESGENLHRLMADDLAEERDMIERKSISLNIPALTSMIHLTESQFFF